MTTNVEYGHLTEYPALLLALEPRTITSEAQANAYREMIDTLTDQRPISPGQ
ncbi:MAG: hypothetical protein ACR2GA_03470 [Chloroflexota bacterium]